MVGTLEKNNKHWPEKRQNECGNLGVVSHFSRFWVETWFVWFVSRILVRFYGVLYYQFNSTREWTWLFWVIWLGTANDIQLWLLSTRALWVQERSLSAHSPHTLSFRRIRKQAGQTHVLTQVRLGFAKVLHLSRPRIPKIGLHAACTTCSLII